MGSATRYALRRNTASIMKILFLFDVSFFQVLAIARFVFLVTAFAFFRIRHYWPVAVSTAVSDGYFIFKIFAIFVEIGVRIFCLN